MERGAIACVVAALMVLGGCGGSEQAMVAFGEAPAARKVQFADAVAAELKGFEDLDAQGVQISVSDANPSPQVTVRGGRISPADLEKALGVVLTNMAFRYPGIGFMADGEGGWLILMPDDMKIPVAGEFDFGIK